MNSVIPRITEVKHNHTSIIDIYITLDNTKYEYIFAFQVTFSFYKLNRNSYCDRICQAAFTLLTDYFNQEGESNVRRKQ